mmetsp:Transcript_96580/g.273102  ORF Transcript_96580/g.273102 Transcript_96580/m.273102 type:complete len:560 (-) Transcript_96580:28-1707(-)
MVEAFPRGPRGGGANASMSLLERDECDGHTWKPTGKILGQGAYGKVQVVQAVDKDGNSGTISWQQDGNKFEAELFAMKTMFKDSKDPSRQERVFKREVSNMKMVEECVGTVRLMDDTPCIVGPTSKVWRPEPASFVMQLIERGTDLFNWYNNLGGNMQAQACWSPSSNYGLLEKLAAQVRCVHERGLVHKDIKADNVFIKLKDRESQCSIEDVHLGDFGVGLRITDEHGDQCYASKLDHGGWKKSQHMPKNLFQGGGNTLGLDDPKDPNNYYMVDPIIDWHSFREMFRSFRVSVTEFLEKKYIEPGALDGKGSAFGYQPQKQAQLAGGFGKQELPRYKQVQKQQRYRIQDLQDGGAQVFNDGIQKHNGRNDIPVGANNFGQHHQGRPNPMLGQQAKNHLEDVRDMYYQKGAIQAMHGQKDIVRGIPIGANNFKDQQASKNTGQHNVVRVNREAQKYLPENDTHPLGREANRLGGHHMHQAPKNVPVYEIDLAGGQRKTTAAKPHEFKVFNDGVGVHRGNSAYGFSGHKQYKPSVNQEDPKPTLRQLQYDRKNPKNQFDD